MDSKFQYTSQNPFVTVFDANESVTSYLTRISGNKKDLLGYFTSDAFDIFPGNVPISFGDGESPIDIFENIDIHNVIQPLDPFYDNYNAPPVDNDWLNSLNV